MSGADGRVLAAWARGGARRPRSLSRLIGDLRAVRTGAARSGARRTPSGAPAPLPAKATRTPQLTPVGLGLAIGSAVPPRGLRATNGEIRLPAGGLVLVANHPVSSTARLIVGRLPWSRRIGCTVLDTAPKNVDRVARRLAAGGIALAFPEGGAHGDGELRDFADWAARLAERAGVPVLPVGVRGALSATRQGRARVGVRLGDPLEPDAGAAEQRAAVRALLAEDEIAGYEAGAGQRAP